ncbi:MAG TPA: hypothetical protein PLW83_09670 [Deltaproteobacteria bacterium]|nr:hypothetical protein [Deltaproteobacteria bacterium]
MTREEFERSLSDFETKVKKRLPSVIGAYLANRSNREFEAAFTHLVDSLDRQRRLLSRDLPKVAKLEQKTRYFNAVTSLDAQLRSMDNRSALMDQMRLRQHRARAPVVYDIGCGPEPGEILNAEGLGIVLETSEKVSSECEVTLEVKGKRARGKALWSIPEETGKVETGLRLVNPPDDFIEEVRRIIAGIPSESPEPSD